MSFYNFTAIMRFKGLPVYKYISYTSQKVLRIRKIQIPICIYPGFSRSKKQAVFDNIGRAR